MLHRRKNIFNNININKTTTNLVEVVSFSVQKFWEIDVLTKLLAINNYRELRDEKLVSRLDFFSSLIKVKKHKPIIIRLGKDFIENFLNQTLEENNKEFDLKNLTQLEVKILNNFCEFIYKRFKDNLLKVEDVKQTEKSEIPINFLFYLKDKYENISHIMITIPFDRLNFEELKKNMSFTDESFFQSKTNVQIIIGKTRLTLLELQHLSKDDIIILENSNISKLILKSGDMVEKFNVKPNPSLIFNLDSQVSDEKIEEVEMELENINSNIEVQVDDDFSEFNNEVTMNKNLWDDIQIEINAEFEKVKMTIGELKQITQGQIVDLGSVFDNQISLYVEDKKVAKGELLIINDKYAVRLDEVLNQGASNVQKEIEKETIEKELKAPKNPKLDEKAPPKKEAQNKTDEEDEEEEFDYSDFEN